MFHNLVYSNIALVAYFALTNHGLIGILFGSLLAQLLVLFMLLLLIIPKVGISVPQLIHAKDYLSYGLPLVPPSLSNWTVDLSDRYLNKCEVLMHVNLFLSHKT
jgi:O-antigen/teichoic acid export membrane protein